MFIEKSMEVRLGNQYNYEQWRKFKLIKCRSVVKFIAFCWNLSIEFVNNEVPVKLVMIKLSHPSFKYYNSNKMLNELILAEASN